MCHNLFLRAVLQVGLVYCFLQVWRHLGIYEVFKDRLGSNSERIFLLISGVRPEHQTTFVSLEWRLAVEVCVLPWPLIGVSRIFYGTQPSILTESLGSGCWCFWTSAVHHHTWENGNSLICVLLWADCGFLNSFFINLQTVQISLISLRIVLVRDLGSFQTLLMLWFMLASQ